MKEHGDTSLRIRLAGMAILGLFIALAAAGYFSGQQVKRSGELIATDAVPGTIDAHKMRMALSRSIGWAMVAASAQTTQSRDECLKTAHDADTAFAEAVNDYKTTIKIDPGKDRALLEQVTSQYEEFHRKRAAYEALILAGDRDGAAGFLERDLVPSYLLAMRPAEDLLDYNHANSIAYAGSIQASVHRLYWTVAVVIVLALLCAAVLLINFSISREEVKKLAQSEERFSRMFQSSPIPTTLRRMSDGKFLDANESFLRMSGFTRKEVIGHTPLDLNLYNDPENYAYVVEQLREHGRLHAHEQLFRTKSGEIRNHFLWFDLLTISGEQCVLVFALDITERIRAEETLREKQGQLLFAMDIARLAHWEFDLEKNLLTGDEHIFQLLGTTSEKEGGLSMSPETYIRKFVHPADAGLVANEVALGVSTADPNFARQFEHRVIRADKTEGVVMVRSRIVMGAAGRPVKIHGTNQDITESRKLEAQFRQAQKMEAVGQLASGVAHDFNNILAVISMQAGLMGNDGGLNPMQTELLSEMDGAVQRAADLTRQLLMFSRRQTMQPRDLDLNSAIMNVSKMLKRILGENIENKFIGSLQPLYVNADAGMMDQVLMNLTVNARDAMPDGGRLIIETSSMDFDETTASQVSQARAGSFACVSVSDTGCGIPPENMQRIFEPFFTTKDVGKGTGLGLATVFGIVQQHQGWINIYSEVGHGTVFRIYLPRLARGSEKETAAPVPVSTFAGSEAILVVEDDPSLRISIRAALSHLGYRVLEAATGAGAIEAWDQNRDEIRLLLSDLMLPGGMNGKQLARRLVEEKPALQVLYISGYSAEVAGKDLVLEEGVNFLTKPFSAHKLAQTIRAKLDS